jgi:hypothetical protein
MVIYQSWDKSSMGNFVYENVRVEVKIDKILQRDDHLVFYVNGNSLAELNENARKLIQQYKEFNGIEEDAYYSLFEQHGKVASVLNAIGRV